MLLCLKMLLLSSVCETTGVNTDLSWWRAEESKDLGYSEKTQVSNCDWRLILLILIRRGSSKKMGLTDSLGLGKNTSVSPYLSDTLTGWKVFSFPFFSLFLFIFPTCSLLCYDIPLLRRHYVRRLTSVNELQGRKFIVWSACARCSLWVLMWQGT